MMLCNRNTSFFSVDKMLTSILYLPPSSPLPTLPPPMLFIFCNYPLLPILHPSFLLLYPPLQASQPPSLHLTSSSSPPLKHRSELPVPFPHSSPPPSFLPLLYPSLYPPSIPPSPLGFSPRPSLNRGVIGVSCLSSISLINGF